MIKGLILGFIATIISLVKGSSKKQKVEDKRTTQPYIQKFISQKKQCTDCQAIVDPSVSICPNCGGSHFILVKEDEKEIEVVNTMESPVVFDEIREKETSKEYNQSTRQDIMNITNNNDNVSKSTYQSKIEKNEPKKRFCKECGSLIDPETKCCSGCGKQYFRGFSKSVIAIIILSVLLAFSGGFNIVELYKSNALYSQIKNGIEEINKKEKALQTQKSELGHVKYENEKLKEINNRYEENVAVVLIPDERSSSPADSIDFDHSYAEYLAKKYYHTFSCSRVDRINDLLSGTSNKIHIYSVQDAKSQGYTACSECH